MCKVDNSKICKSIKTKKFCDVFVNYCLKTKYSYDKKNEHYGYNNWQYITFKSKSNMINFDDYDILVNNLIHDYSQNSIVLCFCEKKTGEMFFTKIIFPRAYPLARLNITQKSIFIVGDSVHFIFDGKFM